MIELAREGRPLRGVALWTDEQGAGLGRSGRQWSSGQGGLYVTAGLPIEPPCEIARVAELAWIPLMAALACAQALEARLGLEAQIKWPNDVLVDGRKIAGILGERVTPENPAGQDVILVGMGLNWLNRPGPDADFRGFRPVSVAELRPGLTAQEREGFLRDWLGRLGERAWSGADGLADLRQLAEERLWSKGLALTLERTEQGRVEGVLLGLGEGGSARMRLKDGREASIHCGWPLASGGVEK